MCASCAPRVRLVCASVGRVRLRVQRAEFRATPFLLCPLRLCVGRLGRALLTCTKFGSLHTEAHTAHGGAHEAHTRRTPANYGNYFQKEAHLRRTSGVRLRPKACAYLWEMVRLRSRRRTPQVWLSRRATAPSTIHVEPSMEALGQSEASSKAGRSPFTSLSMPCA